MGEKVNWMKERYKYLSGNGMKKIDLDAQGLAGYYLEEHPVAALQSLQEDMDAHRVSSVIGYAASILLEELLKEG